MKTDIFLNSLRQKSLQRQIPIISQETQDFLSGFLDNRKPKKILEIGSAICYSTIFFAKYIEQRNGIITSFERSYPSYLEGLYNIKQSDSNNIILYPFNFSQIEIKDFISFPVDLVFMDAQKSQYGNFMKKIESVISQNTTIIIDDVIKYHSKLDELYEYIQQNQVKYKVIQLEQDDWVMVIW